VVVVVCVGGGEREVRRGGQQAGIRQGVLCQLTVWESHMGCSTGSVSPEGFLVQKYRVRPCVAAGAVYNVC
jgi:hypothetical protein